jgi:hypothetical protein
MENHTQYRLALNGVHLEATKCIVDLFLFAATLPLAERHPL